MAWSVYLQCELIKALLDAGANMDVPASDPVGRSVFQHGRLSWIPGHRALAACCYVDVSICGGDNNSTALTWAVRGGKLETVRLLLGYRAKKQLELSGKDAFYWVVHDGRELIRCPLGRCRSSGPRDRSPSTYPIPHGNLSRTSSDCLTAGRRRSRRPSEGILGSLGAVTRCRSRTRGECEMAHRSKG